MARKRKFQPIELIVEDPSVIINDILVITLSIDSREFADLLDEQLQTLIDFEEYETCALLMKLKEKLNEKVTKKARVVV